MTAGEEARLMARWQDLLGAAWVVAVLALFLRGLLQAFVG